MLFNNYLNANLTFFILKEMGSGTTATLVSNFTYRNVLMYANGTGVEWFISPRLTKFGIIYVNTSLQLIVIGKHIDFNNNNVTDLVIQNQYLFY